MKVVKILKLVESERNLCGFCYLKPECEYRDYCPLNRKQFLIPLTPEEFEMFKSNPTLIPLTPKEYEMFKSNPTEESPIS